MTQLTHAGARPMVAAPPASGRLDPEVLCAGGAVPEWVMIIRTGTWLGHPTVPQVVAPAHLTAALDYFERHYAAHGAELVVDYHHASMVAPQAGARAPAAGWIRAIELRNNGTELWGRVLWTTEAAGAIARREYRYLSPVLRFNAPDRVSGAPVLMSVGSVALTNTPFLTELESLNEARGQAGSPNLSAGGEPMTLLETLAQALEKEPEQVASELGLTGAGGADGPGGANGPEDKDVANALMDIATKVKELEATLAARPAAPEYVCNALGIATGSDELAVKAAILRLKSPALSAIKDRLGLRGQATEAEVLNAIGALMETRRKTESEQLVDEAVTAGRVPPAQRGFYLQAALNDLEVARQVINNLPVLTSAPQERRLQAALHDGGFRSLDRGEESVCRQLGLSPQAFLRAAAGDGGCPLYH